MPKRLDLLCDLSHAAPLPNHIIRTRVWPVAASLTTSSDPEIYGVALVTSDPEFVVGERAILQTRPDQAFLVDRSARQPNRPRIETRCDDQGLQPTQVRNRTGWIPRPRGGAREWNLAYCIRYSRGCHGHASSLSYVSVYTMGFR